MNLDHLSASSIGTFLNCPTQWYFRYVEGLKIPPAVAMVQGSSVHRAAEVNYTAKQESYEDLPVDELLDVAHDTFVAGSEDCDWSREKTGPAEALDQTVGMTKVWRTELAPAVQPTAVESRFEISDPSWPVPLVGVIDTETTDFIVDLKTTGRKKSPDENNPNLYPELENDVQSAIYLLKHHREFSPRRFVWHIAVKTKTPAVQVLERQTFDPDWTTDFIAHQQKVMLNAVATGLFSGASPLSYICSAKQCGYWNICPRHAPTTGRK